MHFGANVLPRGVERRGCVRAHINCLPFAICLPTKGSDKERSSRPVEDAWQVLVRPYSPCTAPSLGSRRSFVGWESSSLTDELGETVGRPFLFVEGGGKLCGIRTATSMSNSQTGLLPSPHSPHRHLLPPHALDRCCTYTQRPYYNGTVVEFLVMAPFRVKGNLHTHSTARQQGQIERLSSLAFARFTARTSQRSRQTRRAC